MGFPNTKFSLKIKIHLGRGWVFKERMYEFSRIPIKKTMRKSDKPLCCGNTPAADSMGWKEFSLELYQKTKEFIRSAGQLDVCLSLWPNISVWHGDVIHTDLYARPIHLSLYFISTRVVHKDYFPFFFVENTKHKWLETLNHVIETLMA